MHSPRCAEGKDKVGIGVGVDVGVEVGVKVGAGVGVEVVDVDGIKCSS